MNLRDNLFPMLQLPILHKFHIDQLPTRSCWLVATHSTLPGVCTMLRRTILQTRRDSATATQLLCFGSSAARQWTCSFRACTIRQHRLLMIGGSPAPQIESQESVRDTDAVPTLHPTCLLINKIPLVTGRHNTPQKNGSAVSAPLFDSWMLGSSRSSRPRTQPAAAPRLAVPKGVLLLGGHGYERLVWTSRG